MALRMPNIERYAVQLAAITANLARLAGELRGDFMTHEADLLDRAQRLVGAAREDLELELANQRVED